MHLPKINFIEMSLKENIEIVKFAYFANNDVLDINDYTIKYFPELSNIEPNLSNK